MTFKDLKFDKNQFGDGFGSRTEIGNFILSVQCGARNYCTPRQDLDSVEEYSAFEIAIWPKDLSQDWCTQDFVEGINDDVAGRKSREDIDKVLIKLSNER